MSHWALQAYSWNGAAWVEGRSVIINSYKWNGSAPNSQFCMT